MSVLHREIFAVLMVTAIVLGMLSLAWGLSGARGSARRRWGIEVGGGLMGAAIAFIGVLGRG